MNLLLFFYLLYLSFGSLKWVELKMGQLGVLNNPNYKITALLDHLAMITVQSDHRGTFDCKPLGLIWAQFPEVCRWFQFSSKSILEYCLFPGKWNSCSFSFELLRANYKSNHDDKIKEFFLIRTREIFKCLCFHCQRAFLFFAKLIYYTWLKFCSSTIREIL